MPQLPEREQQIRQAHAQLIHLVVEACQNADARAQLLPMLDQAVTSGWQSLVERIRRILAGARDETLLLGLDDEDTVIVRCILQGIQNPAALPDPNYQGDAALAAPGLASMIHAASRGDAKALHLVADMAEQMLRVGGDMARLGGILRKLIDGERDPDKLTKGMDPSGQQLVLDLLAELGKLGRH
ncbi:MAG TPA: hypothetical protein VIM41_12580 [Gammaproteobacteria bacterium]